MTKRRWALVESEMALVKAIAGRVRRQVPQSIDVEDLISIGTLALVSAAQHFDASRGVGFGAYARFRVRGAMLDSLRRDGNYQYELHDDVASDYRERPDECTERGSDRVPDGVVPIDQRRGPEAIARSHEMVELIRDALAATLDEPERWAILARADGRTLREIGARFGHQESWAHMLVGRAQQKMRRALAMHKLDVA